MTSLGPRFAHAVATKDHSALRGLLAGDVDFRGLTPNRAWEATTADEVLAILFESWFEDTDVVTGLLDVTRGAPVGDTHRVSYRLALSTPDGDAVAEQQAYYRGDGERITHLRVLCSGFRPRTAADDLGAGTT